tara:strand:- start:11607 stop:12539 length:933 start_codon:yes stop_codon:yes gene_type:complete
MKNILVTGGSGFIGSAITNHLLRNTKNKVTVFDDFSRGNKNRLIKSKRLKLIKGNICDYSKVLKACKNINIVIHLAAINGTKFFYESPCEVLSVSSKGIINIMDACIKKKIKTIYLASSSEVYHKPKKIPTDESEMLKIPDIFNPRYSYACGKILTEIYGINFGKKYFKKLVIFRPHNVYGNDMGNEHVIPELINKALLSKNGKIKIKGTGNEKRSFIYIEDFLKAFDLIFNKGKHLQVYNIGTTEIIKIKELVKKIIKITKKKLKITHTKLAKGGTVIRCPNIDKIKKLGFKKKYNLTQGISKIISSRV